MTDRLAAIGCLVAIIGVTFGLALIWWPLAIVVGSVLAGAMIGGAALILAVWKSRGPET